jgi:DinB superfamily
MKRFIWLFAICFVIPIASRAQDSSNPLTATVRKVFDEYSKNVIGAAEAMPPEKYGYRPSPDVRTFGATIAHVADVNYLICGKLLTVPAAQAQKVGEADPKDKLVGALKASMDYCSQAFSKITDSNLAEMVPFFGGRQITRLGVAEAVSYDLVDHYAGLSIYLRMNGLLPPTANKKM